MAFVERVIIYPIKSLDGVQVMETRVTPGGALAHDREYALVDAAGNFVNGKRQPRIHLLRAEYSADFAIVSLRVQGAEQQTSFHLQDERQPLEAWLSEFLGFPVTVQRDVRTGFPDDTEASGPTIISSETLAAVSSWFPNLQIDDVRRRFRANLEIGGVPSFWEEHLYDVPGADVEFAVGPVSFLGANPCQRCAVPARDPLTGEVYEGFQRLFAQRRAETLPTWAARMRFDHYYRLAVNTRIPQSEAGKVIRFGDEIKVLGVNYD